MTQADEIAAVKGLEYLQGFMPYLEDQLDGMKSGIVRRARDAQTRGELTPQLAQALWADYLAADTLLRRMGQKTKATQGLAGRVAGLLTGTPSEG